MAHDETMQALLASFNNPEHARRYGDGPRRFIPGFADLHRMTAILLAERASDDARILVLGAGGGLELRAWADAHPENGLNMASCGWPLASNARANRSGWNAAACLAAGVC